MNLFHLYKDTKLCELIVELQFIVVYLHKLYREGFSGIVEIQLEGGRVLRRIKTHARHTMVILPEERKED